MNESKGESVPKGFFRERGATKKARERPRMWGKSARGENKKWAEKKKRVTRGDKL